MLFWGGGAHARGTAALRGDIGVRLVAISVAHPRSRAALTIGNALTSAALEGQPDQTAYAGAFGALEPMFRADAAGAYLLIAADPRHGIAVAMDRLEAGTLPYPCSFLNSAALYGEVTVSDGGLAFEFHEDARSPRRRPRATGRGGP